MRTLTLYGSSDDLIEADGIPGADEFYWGQSETNTLILLEDNEPQLYIHCFYAYKNISSCWSFSISQIDDGIPLPNWANSLRIVNAENGYSTQLELNVPDNVSMTLHKPKNEDD